MFNIEQINKEATIRGLVLLGQGTEDGGFPWDWEENCVTTTAVALLKQTAFPNRKWESGFAPSL